MKFFFSSRRRHTRSLCDWSSDVCSSDLGRKLPVEHLCAVKPSLRHAIPGRLARGVARELRHSLAVGGVPEKFLRWIHQVRPPWWSGYPAHAPKPLRVFGEPQPTQGQFTPRIPLLLVDRVLCQSKALARSLLIHVFGSHGVT